MSLVLGFAIVYIVGKTVMSSALDRVFDQCDADEHTKKPLMKTTILAAAFATLGAGPAFAGLDNILQSLVTIGVAATLAIDFAMQDVIVNFIAGIFIPIDKPLCTDGWIEWDGNAGVVEDIPFRVTRVRTFDNEPLTVPNSQLTDGVIRNPVVKDKLRLQMPFGIGYNNDIQRATDIILDEAENHEGIMTTSEPSVRLTKLSDSSVTLGSRIWISQPSRIGFIRTRGEYIAAVKKRFDEEGIDIPYPNRTLSGELSVGGAERLA